MHPIEPQSLQLQLPGRCTALATRRRASPRSGPDRCSFQGAALPLRQADRSGGGCSWFMSQLPGRCTAFTTGHPARETSTPDPCLAASLSRSSSSPLPRRGAASSEVRGATCWKGLRFQGAEQPHRRDGLVGGRLRFQGAEPPLVDLCPGYERKSPLPRRGAASATV